jgi:hypothetical protein
LHYIEAHSPVTLRILLQIPQLQKHDFLQIGGGGGGGERAILCRFRHFASREAPIWGQIPPLEWRLSAENGGVLSARFRAEKIPGFCRRGGCGEVPSLIYRAEWDGTDNTIFCHISL